MESLDHCLRKTADAGVVAGTFCPVWLCKLSNPRRTHNAAEALCWAAAPATNQVPNDRAVESCSPAVNGTAHCCGMCLLHRSGTR